MKPTNVTLIANVLVGMFLVLPKDSDPLKESSLQNQGSQIFKAMLCGESELCIPHVGNNTVDRSRQKQRIALVELLGALIGITTLSYDLLMYKNHFKSLKCIFLFCNSSLNFTVRHFFSHFQLSCPFPFLYFTFISFHTPHIRSSSSYRIYLY